MLVTLVGTLLALRIAAAGDLSRDGASATAG